MGRTPRDGETKLRILSAARRLFSEKGFEGVSMEDIAQESGVRKSLIYYYFPSKEVLFEEVWIQVINELESEIFAENENDNSALRMIKRLVRKYVDFVINKSEIVRLIAREQLNVLENGGHLQRAKERYVKLLDRIEAVFERGKQEDLLNNVEPSTAAQLVTSVHAVHRRSLLRNIEDFLLRVLLKERTEH